MKRSIMIAMATTLAMASCQTDDIMDNHPGSTQNANNAIRFDGEAGNMSRANTATGQTAAEKLNKSFVVYGTKTVGETTSTVYNCYNVNYKDGSDNNSTGKWEYDKESSYPLNSGKGNQTIKYWDYSASQYDFVAFSFGYATQGTEAQTTDDTGNTNADKVIAKIETENSSAKLSKLTLTGKAENLAKCYVADLVTAKKPTNNAGEQAETQTNYVSSEYNKPVTFNFHSMATKIQLKIYEEISGYSVKNVHFYTSENDNNPSLKPALFTDADKKIPTGSDKATVTVTFGNEENNKNLAQFEWTMASDASQSTSVTFGTLKNKTKSARQYTRADEGITIGEDKNNASESDIITSIPANLDGGLNMKVNYTLVSDDGSGETITVTGAKVKIDKKYTDWKQNTAYTYIFKIADNTNGSTGGESGEVGLHPIVFDAVVTEDEEGNKNMEDIIITNDTTTPPTPASGDSEE